jgi:hypothetical protein
MFDALGAQPALRLTSTVRNIAYEARIKQAGRGAAMKKFKVWAELAGGIACWVAEEEAPAGHDAPERHILARAGAQWALKAGGEPWLGCGRPTGAWGSAYLPDPLELGAVLTEWLPQMEWEMKPGQLGKQMVRVYRATLEDARIDQLIRRGVLPESADMTSGMGTLGRDFLGRTAQKPKREVTITIYEDLTTRLPIRITMETYQEGAMAAGGFIAVRAGAAPALPIPPAEPAPKDAKEPDQKKPMEKQAEPEEDERKPFLVTEMEITTGDAPKLELLDATARKLLEK